MYALCFRWPRDALIAVSNHFLSGEDITASSDCKKELIIMMGSVHDGVARTCVEYYGVRSYIICRVLRGKNSFNENKYDEYYGKRFYIEMLRPNTTHLILKFFAQKRPDYRTVITLR